MSKKRTWHFEIKKSKNKAKSYLKVIAGNGEPFLAGQMLKSGRSGLKALMSMIEAIKEGRYRVTANPQKAPKKK